jgi:two-component system, NarL family, nitrate/nitrite response regulator NarL
MVHADWHHPSTDRGATYSSVKPAGTVLVLAKARLMRDMIGKILTDGGYIVLGEESYGGEPTFGPPVTDSAWKADFVIVIHERNEISRDALNRIRHAASGKIVLLLRENWMEEVSKEVLVAVDGVLNDEVSADALLHALSVIQRGERVVCRHLAQLFEKPSTPIDAGQGDTGQRKAASLSPREKEIVLRLVHGESNKVIGHGLHITEATVKVHLKAILRKISVQNRTQAAIWAVNNGFDQNIT